MTRNWWTLGRNEPASSRSRGSGNGSKRGGVVPQDGTLANTEEPSPGTGRTPPTGEAAPIVTMRRSRWAGFAIVTFAAAGLLSRLTFRSPDGLGRVADDHGFMKEAAAPAWKSVDFEL
jgi:hypothetical protein